MLSTPPAFILSQDQTLMLKSLPASFFIWLTVFGLKICIFSVLNFLNLFRSAVLILLTLKEFSRLHCCLFVKDQFLFSVVSATALLDYHKLFCLSTPFFQVFLLFFHKYNFVLKQPLTLQDRPVGSLYLSPLQPACARCPQQRM